MTNVGPLRILFFGSDIFSNYSLRGLYNIHKSAPNLIEYIRVVSRPPKWGGKRRSVLRCPAVLKENETLGILRRPILCDNKEEMVERLMPVIRRDGINMIVCVSFGLLVPERVIRMVQYSLNVHPSLLPRYRGSSPIQYALLNNDGFTGVTIQSLHPTKFDKGEIISQSCELDIGEMLEDAREINEQPIFTTRLTHRLGQVGSKMLCELIKNGGYIKRKEEGKYESSLAPRIQSSDRMIQWYKYDANQLYRRLMTLGPLYTFIKCGKNKKHIGEEDIVKRVILHAFNIKEQNLEKEKEKEKETTRSSRMPGSFDIVEDNNNNTRMVIHCINGTSLEVEAIQMAGSVKGTAAQFLHDWNKQQQKHSPLRGVFCSISKK
ncbi:methionyl-tRNA formyltransferase PWA37_000607 [Arxiozyma heterogenica]|uniref:methionyl-tRNA formyltransferase n=1 Tax=Arxiozyma heterogenica TaxID=278026 RepID=UPI002EEA6A3A